MKRVGISSVVLLMLAAVVGAEPPHWVTTWGCGPQLTEPGNLPPMTLANSTLRQLVHVTVGGDRLRVRFSNTYGANPVTIDSAHVALAAGTDAGGIDPATDKMLTFQNEPVTVIQPGGVVLSDPVDFALPALTNLAVTICFGEVSAMNLNGHPGSRTTSFVQPGDFVSAASLPQAKTTPHWYIITGVEVQADGAGKTLVALGDSITDGRGSTTDGNNRWPDDLAQRLYTNAPTASVAVDNMGIGGNGIFGGLGPSAIKRFDRDVIDQSGVHWLIVFEGVNDIGGDKKGTIATNLIAAYAQFINEAHAHNLLAYGATITPFGGNNYFTASHEAARQAVNTWIRTNRLYDGVIDFDAAVRDPMTLTNLLPAYNCGDGLHLNPAGYRAMANAINLNLFVP